MPVCLCSETKSLFNHGIGHLVAVFSMASESLALVPKLRYNSAFSQRHRQQELEPPVPSQSFDIDGITAKAQEESLHNRWSAMDRYRRERLGRSIRMCMGSLYGMCNSLGEPLW